MHYVQVCPFLRLNFLQPADASGLVLFILCFDIGSVSLSVGRPCYRAHTVALCSLSSVGESDGLISRVCPGSESQREYCSGTYGTRTLTLSASAVNALIANWSFAAAKT